MGKASRRKTSISEIKSDQGGRQKTLKSSHKLLTKNSLYGTTSKATFLQMVVVVLVSFAVYFNALYNGFVYDDNFQILGNPWVKDAKYLPEIFSKSVWSFIADPTLTPTSNYYRPLMYIIYMFNYYVFGLKPWGFHLVNILFHAGNTALVFMIASKLLRENEFSTPTPPSTLPSAFFSPPFIAALFFAVHPIHTEAVTWIASLPEVSFTCFSLLSLYLYMRSTEGETVHSSLYLFSLASFFLAALCKETALTLPVILIVYDYSIHKDKSAFPMRFRRYVPYCVAAAVYLVLRINAIGAIAPSMNQYGYLSTYQYIINMFPLFLQYLGKLFLPINLNAYQVLHPILSLSEPKGIIALIITTAFVLFAFISRKKDGVVLLSLSIITVPLLPALYIPGLGRNTFAERYLYLPSVGFVILLAILYARSLKRTPRYGLAIFVVATLLTGLCSIQTIIRNQVWKNNMFFFTDTVQKSPEAEDPNGWLGFALMETGRDDEAIEQFRNTLRLNPNAVRSHKFLGSLLLKKGLLREAISHYQTALSMYPNDLDTRQDMADAYMKSGMIDQAKEQYQILGKLSPNSLAIYVNQGTALAEKGLVNEAITQYEKALAIDPNSVDAHYNLGSAYANSGQMDKALDHFKAAVRLQPDNAFYHDSLGRAYSLKGLYDEAIEQFKVAIQLSPAEPAYRKSLDRTLGLKNSTGNSKHDTDTQKAQ